MLNGHKQPGSEASSSATDRADQRIPVTLLTGFLGSGKTTILNHLVRQSEMADALVIINEFGEVALDHLLVAHSTENLLMEMSSGCLCCTIRGDLVKTLRDITWRFSRGGQRQFRRVVIETTGLADPAPIIHTLVSDPQISPKYRLDGVVTTIDQTAGAYTLDQHIEAVKQAAVADILLLTKGDLAEESERSALAAWLERINPGVARYVVNAGEIAPAKVLDLGIFPTQGKHADVERWLADEAIESHDAHMHADHVHGAEHGHQHDVNRHNARIQAFSFAFSEPISEASWTDWLEALKDLLGGNILRIKGILNLEGRDRPTVIHGVQHTFHEPVSLPAWPSEDRRSRLVFITQDLTRAAVEATFEVFGHRISSAGETVP